MRKPLIFSVTNHHIESCGKPPQIDDSAPKQYRGYFENEYGKQALFVYDRTTRQGARYMGDAGWERPFRVVNGVVPDLVMGANERAWLAACWNAATGAESR